MVVIEDAGAFDLLARMEGEQWRRIQEAHPDDPYGYSFWRRAWDTKVAAGLRDIPAPLPSFAERAVRESIIYGAEGYRRYRILPDGEIVLECDTALPDARFPDACARAHSLGFRVT
ncbi:MAG: hypothetical protein ACKVQU_18060 [Burkholderiales bacterium]